MKLFRRLFYRGKRERGREGGLNFSPDERHVRTISRTFIDYSRRGNFSREIKKGGVFLKKKSIGESGRRIRRLNVDGVYEERRGFINPFDPPRDWNEYDDTDLFLIRYKLSLVNRER